MTLDAYLALKGISAADAGRQMGLQWPYQVRKWLLTLKSGKPNRGRTLPSHRNQLRVRKWSGGKVTLDSWPPVKKDPT